MLRRIASAGRDGFYTGETAGLIVDEMKNGGGIITREDLERYQPKWRDPVAFTYRGHRVISMPPPSSGGVTLAMIAQQLEAYDLARLGWHSAPAIHVQAEAMRRAFAVRNDTARRSGFRRRSTSARLSSKAFARELQSTIAIDHATPSRTVSGRSGGSHDGPHTTHFSVVDVAGNAVALTTTINSGFGSAVTVTGGGFLLNDEMDDFAAKPGSPNEFGLVQGEANAIAPGKRMLSAMTPTIVLGDGGTPALVTGASGGPFIITTAWEVMSNVLDYGMNAGSAMSAPRMHHQHLPDADRARAGWFRRLGAAGAREAGPSPDVLRGAEEWLDGCCHHRTARRRVARHGRSAYSRRECRRSTGTDPETARATREG